MKSNDHKIPKKPGLEFTPEFERTLDLLENTNKSVFITGRAGTGKSTLLDYFRHHTRKKVVVLAPTGVAALNVSGQPSTLLWFPTGHHPDRVKKLPAAKRALVKNLEAMIIDEISMVRADLLDCVDRALGINREFPDLPFGGLQMILIGDLYQLPPVVTNSEKPAFSLHYESPYFFSPGPSITPNSSWSSLSWKSLPAKGGGFPGTSERHPQPVDRRRAAGQAQCPLPA